METQNENLLRSEVCKFIQKSTPPPNRACDKTVLSLIQHPSVNVNICVDGQPLLIYCIDRCANNTQLANIVQTLLRRRSDLDLTPLLHNDGVKHLVDKQFIFSYKFLLLNVVNVRAARDRVLLIHAALREGRSDSQIYEIWTDNVTRFVWPKQPSTIAFCLHLLHELTSRVLTQSRTTETQFLITHIIECCKMLFDDHRTGVYSDALIVRPGVNTINRQTSLVKFLTSVRLSELRNELSTMREVEHIMCRMHAQSTLTNNRGKPLIPHNFDNTLSWHSLTQLLNIRPTLFNPNLRMNYGDVPYRALLITIAEKFTGHPHYWGKSRSNPHPATITTVVALLRHPRIDINQPTMLSGFTVWSMARDFGDGQLARAVLKCEEVDLHSRGRYSLRIILLTPEHRWSLRGVFDWMDSWLH